MQWLTTRVKLGKLRDALTNNNPLYDNDNAILDFDLV